MAEQKSCGGKSILEILWDQLMGYYKSLVYAKWLVEELRDHPGDHSGDVAQLLIEAREESDLLRGKCLGLGTAIATIINPYNPNVDAVRAECVTRAGQK